MINETKISESSSPKYQHRGLKHKTATPIKGDEEHRKKIVAHIKKYIGDAELVWQEMISSIIQLEVYYIRPTEKRNYHTFITSGMSTLPMVVPKDYEEWQYSELMMSLPLDWPIDEAFFLDEKRHWPIQFLKMLARFPHQYNTWLSYGHTIPNGDPIQPFSEDTKLCCSLILSPTDVEPEFLVCEMSAQKKVNFFSIIPLYKEEMDYKVEHGIDKLIDKLDENNINEVLDLKRKNVCKKKLLDFLKA